MASSPLSKKKMIPRNEKKIPNPVKPSPISDYNKEVSMIQGHKYLCERKFESHTKRNARQE